MTSLYVPRIVALIEEAARKNDGALDKAAAKFAATLAAGGFVHMFGGGHSVLPVQEAFPRYGAYVGFNPLMDPRLMWHNVVASGGVREVMWIERAENYISHFLDYHPFNAGDCLIIFSHSGRNAARVEAAQYVKALGVSVVAVTSSHNFNLPVTHSSGKRVADLADIVIDTGAPVEDALVPIKGWSRPVSGSSTVLAMVLIHEMLVRTATALGAQGIEMPTFAYPTIPGVTPATPTRSTKTIASASRPPSSAASRAARAKALTIHGDSRITWGVSPCV